MLERRMMIVPFIVMGIFLISCGSTAGPEISAPTTGEDIVITSSDSENVVIKPDRKSVV